VTFRYKHKHRPRTLLCVHCQLSFLDKLLACVQTVTTLILFYLQWKKITCVTSSCMHGWWSKLTAAHVLRICQHLSEPESPGYIYEGVIFFPSQMRGSDVNAQSRYIRLKEKYNRLEYTPGRSWLKKNPALTKATLSSANCPALVRYTQNPKILQDFSSYRILRYIH